MDSKKEKESPKKGKPEADAGAQGDEAAAENVEARPVELSPIEESDQKDRKSDESVNLKLILDLPVDIQAELGHTQMSIREVLKLGQGSVIQLDRSAGSSADIIVNGKFIGQGEVVVVDENFGVRVTKLLSPEERIESL